MKILLLGDLHYTVRADSPRAALWRNGGGVLSLLAAVSDVARREGAAQVLQLGDLVEGDAPDAIAHEAAFAAAWRAVKSAVGDTPAVAVRGNHDVFGGCFAETSPFCADAQTARPQISSNNAIALGDDTMICLDSTRPEETASALSRLLDETSGCRRTFIAVHHPVIPVYYGQSYRSILFGDAVMDDIRTDTLERLARRDAVVLCGHVHTCGFVDWRWAGGRIRQFHVSSLWDGEEPALRQIYTDPDEYGRFYEREERSDAAALFAEFRRGLAAYRHFEGGGFATLQSSSDGIAVALFGGDSRTPFARIET